MLTCTIPVPVQVVVIVPVVDVVPNEGATVTPPVIGVKNTGTPYCGVPKILSMVAVIMPPDALAERVLGAMLGSLGIIKLVVLIDWPSKLTVVRVIL